MLTVLVVVVAELNSSVNPLTAGAEPPKANPNVFVPAPPRAALPVAKSATSVHEVPSQISVTPTYPGDSPPTANAFVLLFPIDAGAVLPSFKSLTSVQFVPFHNSAFALIGEAPP